MIIHLLVAAALHVDPDAGNNKFTATFDAPPMSPNADPCHGSVVIHTELLAGGAYVVAIQLGLTTRMDGSGGTTPGRT